MVKVAVAGGTSPTLGRSIVTAITQTTNTPIILTRQSPNAPTNKYGAEVRQVDYTNDPSLFEALRDVHTVISVLKIPGPDWATHQVNLLNAAKRAGVKRFAPSEFENGPDADGRVDILGLKPGVWKECLESGLECARFSGGMFMNYLALGKDFGGDAQRQLAVTQNLDDTSIIWNLPKLSVEMPVKDDGTAPKITLTDIRDIGRFVAAACELPDGQWRRSMEIAGDTIDADEVTRAIEEASGKMFQRSTIDRKALQKRVSEIEGIGSSREEIVEKLVGQIELMMLEDKEGMTIMRPVVNELCPHVKPTSVREFVDHCWKDG